MNDLVEKNIDMIEYLLVNNTYRERLEYIKAYEFGMNWMEEMKGGAILHNYYNKLLERAKRDNDIVVDYDNDVIETKKKRIELGVNYERK